MESIAAQRRILKEVAQANRSLWAWFPPIFVLAFSLLSFAGTYIGLRDIIATGDLKAGWVGDVLVFALVALATGAMVYFLRRAVTDFWSLGGIAALLAYLLMLFFSVTFGFAFYWGRLEASNQAIAGAQGKIESLSDDIQTSAFRLQSTATGLTALSGEFKRLAELERTVGGTCGDGSAGGYGPRTRHRERRAQAIEAQVAQIQPRFAVVEGAVAAMGVELANIDQLRSAAADTGEDRAAERAAQFKQSRQAARSAALEINALASDPGLLSLAALYRQWGQEYMDPTLVRRDDPKGQPYQCVQPAAGQLLLSASAQLENLPRVNAPELPAYAGPAATREAVFRMLNTVGAVLTGDLAFFEAGAAPEPSHTPPSATLTAPAAPYGAGSALAPQSVGGDPYDPTAAETGLGLGAGPATIRSPSPAPRAAPAYEGLRADDRFPLAVALIIDALLFAFVLIERPGRRYFDRMKNVAEEARHAFQPLRMIALREGLEQDREWRMLSGFRFDIGDRSFVAAPRGAEKEEDRFRVLMVRDVLRLFERNGMVQFRPAAEVLKLAEGEGLVEKPFRPRRRDGDLEPPTQRERMEEMLQALGRPDLQRYLPMDFYEFRPEGMERLLMASMADVRKREADLFPPDERSAWSRWLDRAERPAEERKEPEPAPLAAPQDAPWRPEPAPLRDEPLRRPAAASAAALEARPTDFRAAAPLALGEKERVAADLREAVREPAAVGDARPAAAEAPQRRAGWRPWRRG